MGFVDNSVNASLSYSVPRTEDLHNLRLFEGDPPALQLFHVGLDSIETFESRRRAAGCHQKTCRRHVDVAQCWQ